MFKKKYTEVRLMTYGPNRDDVYLHTLDQAINMWMWVCDKDYKYKTRKRPFGESDVEFIKQTFKSAPVFYKKRSA